MSTNNKALNPNGDQKRAPSGAVLCKGKCGFFGNSATDDYCSQCWKKQPESITNSKSAATAAAAAVNPASASPSSRAAPASTPAPVSPASPVATASTTAATFTPAQPAAAPAAAAAVVAGAGAAATATATATAAATSGSSWSRCAREGCRKKLGLSGIDCKCGKTFCTGHRMPLDHDCTFDFKKLHSAKLTKQNPLVSKSKFEQI